ncbi:MAG: DNA methyltransferase [Candidatus Kapabacteria bacterium]|nr:DNA methyltransferase [Candidatus Kapabacteria bacterium]
MFKEYLENLQNTLNRGDAREESFYEHLKDLILSYADSKNIPKIDITILPKKTEAGNPDFRIWDGRNHITGYIEAKDPSIENLDYIENTEQLKRYRETFPNVILTNFYEFRLYRDGERIRQVAIARPAIANKLRTAPPLEHIEEFQELLDLFFSFSLPKVQTSRSLAKELAKRTRFLCDEVITIELAEEAKKGQSILRAYYDAFREFLIGTLTEKTFADLYSQTLTYGLFAARSRATGEFNRQLAFQYIPQTIGILRDVFRFISLEDPPKSMQVIIDDISEVLAATDVNKILQDYYQEGKGQDPIMHFYETFLTEYDPNIREKRGVYYTPEPVVGYIVRSIHKLLKTHFGIADGLAGDGITLLDPAAGTLTFPAEAVKLAVQEYEEKYGAGGISSLIRNKILPNYYAFELMMAPYAIGHIKIGYLLEELGYKLSDDERFKLYLTNTLDMEDLAQIEIPLFRSLSRESHSAAEVKKEKNILVILGNPPYSGISENKNEWSNNIVKKDADGAQSYYKVDGHPLGEKKVWLQDDYVKFLRFAQWKIHKAGIGIVGMITNHSYLDNPTFRGMRQSLMGTFNEIYIINLHGNSLKKEKAPEGGKDENVFDIQQGTAITIFVKQKDKTGCEVYYRDLYGLREEKFEWLNKNELNKENYIKIHPDTPWYFFIPRDTESIMHYQKWENVKDIFPVNVTGIVTARDNFVIDIDRKMLNNRISQFRNKTVSDEIIRYTYKLKDTRGWNLSEARQKLMKDENWQSYFKEILYRPFDIRFIYYTDTMIDWGRTDVMQNMWNGGNLGLITIRRSRNPKLWNYAFVSDKIIAGATAITSLDINYFFPLYIFTDENHAFNHSKSENRKPNINPEIFKKLREQFTPSPLTPLPEGEGNWQSPLHQGEGNITPESIFFYVYAVLYSNTYREKYAEFLKIDFPRIPFTSNYNTFLKFAEYGKRLVDLHLLNSSELERPISHYQGISANDKIEKIEYNEHEQRVYINKDKYFDNVSEELWNYYIGGYQVLQKFLKDRKGRTMDNPPQYCRIITAIAKTIEIQQQIDEDYSNVESQLI